MKRPLISILSIAGSDSCAGAGIQADVKAAASCGIYCTTAITAVTAQSTGGVDKVIPIGPCDVKAQILSVLEDGLPDAIKIGMIGSVKTGLEIVSLLQNQLKEIPVVVDPVLGSTSGKSFASGKESLVDFYKDSLLPLSTIVTPNINEASALLNKNLDITDIKSQTLVAKELLSTLRCRSVVLKGGHTRSESATDILVYRGEDGECHISDYGSPRIACDNLHGTGCTYSTFLACGLAQGMTVEDAFIYSGQKIKKIIAESCYHSYGPHCNGPLSVFGFRTK